ncbi:MAG: VOC family protein [Actinobacteria bacterium]|nr:VOC family protein [Actinomycetota bacterium]
MEPVIDHINRYVSSVEEHVSFYTRVLGYELIDRGNKGDGKEYAILSGCEHELFISEADGSIEPDRSLRHIGYAVENADVLLADFKRKGIAGREVELVVKPYSRQFYLEDPDGNEIDFIQWTDKERFRGEARKKGGDPR